MQLKLIPINFRQSKKKKKTFQFVQLAQTLACWIYLWSQKYSIPPTFSSAIKNDNFMRLLSLYRLQFLKNMLYPVSNNIYWHVASQLFSPPRLPCIITSPFWLRLKHKNRIVEFYIQYRHEMSENCNNKMSLMAAGVVAGAGGSSCEAINVYFLYRHWKEEEKIENSH